MWAACATGLEAVAWRSTDGGVSFKPLWIPGCCANTLRLGAASADVALAARNAAGRGPLRTTDGGATWRQLRTPGSSIDWFWIGFADARVGSALVQTRPTGPFALWRTTNGGATWFSIPLR